MAVADVHEDPPPDRLKPIREWLDVGAKVVIAGVGLLFAYLADDYKQTTSIITLLSQREAAESQLRASMLQNLIDPFVGGAEGDEPLDANRARVLLDLLALNFHTHFELKPLWLKVDAELKKDCGEAQRSVGAGFKKDCEKERNALRSVARRVVDRQIQMLMAASAEGSNRWYSYLFAKRPAKASQVDLFFQKAPRKTEEIPSRVLRAKDVGSDREAGQQESNEINSFNNRALFDDDSGVYQAVCTVSPNSAYAWKLIVRDFNAEEGTVTVQWWISADEGACKEEANDPVEEVAWTGGESFTITPYDLPLTDSAPIDSRQRFALNLFDIYSIKPEEDEPILVIKLVWFPEGYITERERPMNYYQVNETLGLQ